MLDIRGVQYLQPLHAADGGSVLFSVVQCCSLTVCSGNSELCIETLTKKGDKSPKSRLPALPNASPPSWLTTQCTMAAPSPPPVNNNFLLFEKCKTCVLPLGNAVVPGWLDGRGWERVRESERESERG